MSNSIKYYKNGSEEEFVFITYDSNEKNLKVYFKGKMIHHSVDGVNEYKGLTVDYEDQQISIQKSGKALRIFVNSEEYYPDVFQKEPVSLNGISIIFYIMFGFSFFGTIIEVASASPYMSTEAFMLILGIDGFLTIIYGVTGFCISKRIYWFYFIGTGFFTLTSLFTLLTIVTGIFPLNLVSILALLIRFTMLVIVWLRVKDVIAAMNSKKPNQEHLILDQH